MFMFFLKHKTSYGRWSSDGSSDVCSSDLLVGLRGGRDNKKVVNITRGNQVEEQRFWMGAVMRLVSRLVSRCWMTALGLSAGLAAGDAQAALQGRAVPTNGDPIAIEIGEGQLLRLDRAKIGRAHV